MQMRDIFYAIVMVICFILLLLWAVCEPIL